MSGNYFCQSFTPAIVRLCHAAQQLNSVEKVNTFTWREK